QLQILLRPQSTSLVYIALAALAVTNVYLCEFGRNLICLATGRLCKCTIIIALEVLFIISVFVFREQANTWARYLLAFPGGVLSSAGIFLYYRSEKEGLDKAGLRLYFLAAGSLFGVYALLEGLVVPAASFPRASFLNYKTFSAFFGVPVQLLCGLWAVPAAWIIYHILKTVDAQTQENIRKALHEAEEANTYMDAIIKAMSDSLIVVSSEGKIMRVNKTILDLSGHALDELVGQSIAVLFPYKPLLASGIGVIIQRGGLTNYETMLCTKNRGTIPVLLSIAVLKADGKVKPLAGLENYGDEILGVLYLAKDITELKRAEEKIKLAYAELSQIFNTITAGLRVVDKHGYILRVNNAFSDFAGLSKDEIVGRKCREVMSAGRCDTPSCVLKLIIEGHGHVEFEVEKKDAEGGKKIFHVVGAPYRDGEGNVIGVLEEFKDITKLKEAEQSLKLAYEQLKSAQEQLIQTAKMNVIGSLASGVAHEVKNPLAIILQGVDFLKRKISAEEQNVVLTLSYMSDAVRRADAIIKGLLDFSNVTELVMARQDINDLVKAALLLVKHELDKHHIEMVTRLEQGILQVMMDRNKMEQVLVNLALNAVYAMPNGGRLIIKTYTKDMSAADINMDETLAPETKIAVIEIEDTGFGIPQEFMDKIFDPFFTTRRGQGGTGIGLSVVLSVIKMHRGKIEIRNKPPEQGPGVLAKVMLPIS
ncbi:MAG: PAS domain S-box protein, partial [Candidatus Omnitrophica bacterium]|nr:PAS domain S-box protein [Candidatus Omnitrophota bacterium]